MEGRVRRLTLCSSNPFRYGGSEVRERLQLWCPTNFLQEKHGSSVIFTIGVSKLVGKVVTVAGAVGAETISSIIRYHINIWEY